MVLQYLEDRKVDFGIFQLEGIAKDWWRIIEQKWEQIGTPRTWDNFISVFRNKFIPEVVKERKQEEFIYLRQRTMTVAQYEKKFNRLSKYAPDLVDTDIKRNKRFIQGLNLEIQDALVTVRMDTYADLVDYALRVEDSKARLKEFRDSKKLRSKRKMMSKVNSSENQTGTFRKKSRKDLGKQNSEEKTSRHGKRGQFQGQCHYCGKNGHKESKCWRKVGKCLLCGSLEHQARQCVRFQK
ncbi:hypothetical protein BHUM_04587c [Candidatus Burkholderia humilis]|nr:hypothetical protein BHUM_04587c [Candidatus Burkholderia humilis]